MCWLDVKLGKQRTDALIIGGSIFVFTIVAVALVGCMSLIAASLAGVSR